MMDAIAVRRSRDVVTADEGFERLRVRRENWLAP
jgi:hypothetical protein